MKLGWNISAPW